eukprot:1594825-Rhodomonas_salina.2
MYHFRRFLPGDFPQIWLEPVTRARLKREAEGFVQNGSGERFESFLFGEATVTLVHPCWGQWMGCLVLCLGTPASDMPTHLILQYSCSGLCCFGFVSIVAFNGQVTVWCRYREGEEEDEVHGLRRTLKTVLRITEVWRRAVVGAQSLERSETEIERKEQ